MLTRRLAVALLVAAFVLAAPAAAPQAQASSARLSRSEQAVVRLVNRIRAQHHLAALRSCPHLARAADRHSGDMLRHDFFAHPSSDGTPFDRRVRSYARARSVGEDLAMASASSGLAQTVVGMWMNSPPHRAVLLSASFRRVGIGQRSGQLGSRRATVVTADFASRR